MSLVRRVKLRASPNSRTLVPRNPRWDGMAMGVSKNERVFLGSPWNKYNNIFGLHKGDPLLLKLPNVPKDVPHSAEVPHARSAVEHKAASSVD